MSVPVNPSRVSKRLRFEILRRDNHTCRYCGGTAPDVKLTVDHVVPVALGGGSEPSNLAASCADCNSGKSATPADAAVVEQVAEDAARWGKAMALAAQAERAVTDAVDTTLNRLDTFWTNYGTGPADGRSSISRDPGWRDSWRHMLAQGLTADDIEHAVRTSMGKTTVTHDQVWRYSCGIAWRTLEDRQKRAKAIIDSGVV